MRKGSRRRHRLDSNHAEIAEALRAAGWEVVSTSMIGGAFPDLIAQRRGELLLVEVKTTTGAVTKEQMDFRLRGWPVAIIRSVEEALKL